MKFLFQVTNIISCAFVVIYSLYEILKDIIDTVLNVLILITSSWAVKKLLMDILKEEEKVKMTCGYAIVILYLASLEWTYRACAERNTNILNFISGLFMLCLALTWIYYGIKYEDKYFLYPNLAGVFSSIIYLYNWNRLRKKYGYVVPIKKKKEEEKKEKKDDNKENKDNKEVKEEKKENKNDVEVKEIKENIVDDEKEKIIEEKKKNE